MIHVAKSFKTVFKVYIYIYIYIYIFIYIYNYCFTCFTFLRTKDRRFNYIEGIFEVNIGIV